jgi:uncharacterized protein (DUF1778 family)
VSPRGDKRLNGNSPCFVLVVAAVQEAAQQAIEQAEVVRLSLADQESFAQALLSPPEPAPALQRAIERRRRLLRPAE